MKRQLKYAFATLATCAVVYGGYFSYLDFSIREAYKNRKYDEAIEHIGNASKISTYHDEIAHDVVFSNILEMRHTSQEDAALSESTLYDNMCSVWPMAIGVIQNHEMHIEMKDPYMKKIYERMKKEKDTSKYGIQYGVPSVIKEFYPVKNKEYSKYYRLHESIQDANKISNKDKERFKAFCSVEIMRQYLMSFQGIYSNQYASSLKNEEMKEEEILGRLESSLNNYMTEFKKEMNKLASSLDESQRQHYARGVSGLIYSYIDTYNYHIFESNKLNRYNKAAALVKRGIKDLYLIGTDLEKKYDYDQSIHNKKSKMYFDMMKAKAEKILNGLY